jgi:hypothetical protein
MRTFFPSGNPSKSPNSPCQAKRKPQMSSENGRPEEGAIKEQFKQALKDLTFNSKPIITTLTMILAENTSYSKLLLDSLLEETLAREPPSEKLPLLYLLDSGLKNIGQPYLQQLEPLLSGFFKKCYPLLPQPDQLRMDKVLQTWFLNPSTGKPLFPLGLLQELKAFVTSQKNLSRLISTTGNASSNYKVFLTLFLMFFLAMEGRLTPTECFSQWPLRLLCLHHPRPTSHHPPLSHPLSYFHQLLSQHSR